MKWQPLGDILTELTPPALSKIDSHCFVFEMLLC